MIQTVQFDAIGTKWQIDIETNLSSENNNLLFKIIKDRISEFDRTYSRFRSDALIKKMVSKTGVYKLPEDALPLLLIYRQLYLLTDGALTPLIGQTLVDAGYDEAYSLNPKQVRPPLSWDEALSIDFPELTVKKPCILDFGAAGKGYLIDIVANILENYKINSFCINAGGDICRRTSSEKLLKVGLENPDNFNQVIGVALIANQSICACAGTRRKWANYHHLIDPHTLTSPNKIKAIWVIANTTILADALATSLFFVSPEKLSKEYDFEYTILEHDFSITKSVGFQGEFFIKK